VASASPGQGGVERKSSSVPDISNDFQAQPIPMDAPTDLDESSIDKFNKDLREQEDQINKEIQDKQSQARLTNEAIQKKQMDWDDTINEAKNFKWEQKGLWESAGTGQKIALLIGGALSSLSPQSAEAFRKNVSDALDRDMMQKKSQYEALKEKGRAQESALGQLTQKLGSEQAGVLAMRGHQLQLIQPKLKEFEMRAQARTIKDNAIKQQQALALEQQKLLVEQQKLARETANDTRNIDIGKYKGFIPDKQAANTFRNQAVAAENLNQTLDKIDALARQGVKLSPEKRGQVATLLTVAVNQAKDALNIGKLSDYETEDLMDAIGDPRKWNSTYSGTKGKLNAMRERVRSAVDTNAKALRLYSDIGVLK
jgi:hypothetical protein